MQLLFLTNWKLLWLYVSKRKRSGPSSDRARWSVCDPHPYVPEGQEGEELISLLLYEWVLRESRRGMRIQGKAANWVNSR